MRETPPILLKKLAQLRRRERLLSAVWGIACFLSLVLVVLLAACLVDWLLDMWDETPLVLRRFMLYGQFVVAALAVLLLVLGPQLRRLRNEMLALFVESKRPELQHRLISALELNRAGAKTEGMSPELLTAVTNEAVEQTQEVRFAALADHSRLTRSAKVFVPAALIALLLFLLNIDTALALLRRQMLDETEIPRSISVTSLGPDIWKVGEEVPLRFEVNGPSLSPERTGSVRVKIPVSRREFRYFSVPLVFEKATGEESAIFLAKVPAGTVDFAYMAKVGDGRTRKEGAVHFVERPSVIEQKAYVILPDYVGLGPAEAAKGIRTKYQQEHVRGDIVGMPGLSVRVVIKTQKPITKAVLQIHGAVQKDLSGPGGLTRMHEAKSRMVADLSAVMLRPSPMGPLNALASVHIGLATVPLENRRFEKIFENPVETAEWQFDLKATETSYRVSVFDIYGFESKTESVRTIKVEPEPAPTITLHAEYWDPPPAFKSRSKMPSTLDFEGLPLPLVEEGRPGPLRISYDAFGPYGVGEAKLRIRIYRGGGTGSQDDNKKLMVETWKSLIEMPADTDREFDKQKGAFTDSEDKEQIEFYAVPVPRAAKSWPRVFAGGRFDFFPAGILDEDGEPFAFKPGDQVVLHVEVFNCNYDANKALMAKSRLREKDVVPLERFMDWLAATLQEADRIGALMYMQQQVYDRPWFSIFGKQP